MEYNLWPLVGAAILLCTPSYLFFNSRIRRRIAESLPSGGFPLVGILLTWQNWLDLVRGFGGAYLLYHHVFALESHSETYMDELGAIAGLLALALLLNTYYKRKHLYCLAPLFLVAGMSLVIFEWWIVLYGAAGGAIFGRIINSPEVYHITMAVVIGAFGYFFGGISLMLLLTCALILLPIVYAFTTKRGLIAASHTGSAEE